MNIGDFLGKFSIIPKNLKLYEEALTHNSYANEKRAGFTYQRLEFLGDAILQMYVSLYFFNEFPNEKEGVLTKYRSNSVREETLAAISKEIKIGSIIRLGIGEINSKGYEKSSILADVFESFTAAIYLDQGHEILQKWLNQTMLKYISEPGFMDKNVDFKSELQELLQAENRHDLVYKVIDSNHTTHNRTRYQVALFLEGFQYGIGEGFSKQEAEQMSAKDCLQKLKK
ncbi:ribonuclease III [Spiroplasma sabaudiense Ar-1343]|uniref:Ribonuclease 3 n=1 Tax=Spiroplasma sabaudiense Ar-1343 TaxID=1276257 RepID=W6AK00_9MOLU|nr:ribonuclease III [Spiroplasma sabaudiense]AHI54054.1 ribonuclease III [Spiroplasma sabaudiense Ar-1343]